MENTAPHSYIEAQNLTEAEKSLNYFTERIRRAKSKVGWLKPALSLMEQGKAAAEKRINQLTEQKS